LIYKFGAILFKIPTSYFVDINKLFLKKFIWKDKELVNTVLKKNKFVGFIVSYFKTFTIYLE